MSDANLGFLARQLMLTELYGSNLEEIDGGLALAGKSFWAGVIDIIAVTEPEAYVRKLTGLAESKGLPFGGAIFLLKPNEMDKPVINELTEAFYVYGCPRIQGLAQGGPDILQVLGKPPKATGNFEVIQSELESEAVSGFFDQLANSDDRLDSPCWEDEDEVMSRTEHFIARRDGVNAGMICLTSAELAVRISAYWVAPEFRGEGVGKALVAHASEVCSQQGRLFLCAWTNREGKLRYYFNKHGFEDQLSVIYYMNEE